MSLIDRGNRTAIVRQAAIAADERGNLVPTPSGDPVTVQCFIMPAEATANMTQGAQTRTEFDLYTRVFPAGPWASVEVDGVLYEVIGRPKVYDAGVLTPSGTVVRIREL